MTVGRKMTYSSDIERPEKEWNSLECWFMNLLDFRFWFCECHYRPPYGLVLSADCKKHD